MKLLFFKFSMVGMVAILVGCTDRDLKPSSDWKPKALNAEITVTNLPPQEVIKGEFLRWRNSVTNTSLLLYEIDFVELLTEPKINLHVARSETPLGRPWYTYASITVENSTGTYQLDWQFRGKITKEKLQDALKGKTIWLQPLLYETNANLQLLIVGIEGIQPTQILVAP